MWKASGLVTGSGSDWASYNYWEEQPLSSNVWGALSSGTGGASGGSSATWSYAGGNADGGDDTYSQTKDGGTVSGTLGESGSQTYNTDYNGTAAVVSGAWTQTGTGDANGTDTYNYNYAGSGSGASGGTTWHVTSESGSGSGSFGYDNPLTLSGGTLAGDSTAVPSGSTTQEDSYAYNASNGYSGSEQETTTQEIAGNELTGTSTSASGSMNVPGGSVSWSPGDGTDSLWDQAGGGELGPQPGALGVYAAVISPAVVHSGGIDLPGSPYDDGEPDLPSAASPATTTFIFGTPTNPGTTTNDFTSLSTQASPGMVSETAPVSSLASLSSTASLVDAVWGMGNVADPGYRGMNTSAIANDLVDTLIAAGNLPGATVGFTSETIVGAEGVFYADDVAVAIPTTRATPLIGYGTSGVSAGSNAPVNVSDGVDWSAPYFTLGDALIPCSTTATSDGAPTEITFKLPNTPPINTGDIESVKAVDGNSAIEVKYLSGAGDTTTFKVSVSNLATTVPDSAQRNWLLAQAGISTVATTPTKAQAAAAAGGGMSAQDALAKDNERRIGGLKSLEKENNYDISPHHDAATTVQNAVNTAGDLLTAAGAAIQVIGLEAYGAAEFGIKTVQASGEFLEQFANAPFTTTYQTVVKLGQGVYTVIANPGLVLNGAVDIAAKLLDPNVDPKVKGYVAANLLFALAVPGGAEAKALPEVKEIEALLKAGKEAKAIEVAKGVVVKQGRIIERTGEHVRVLDVGKLARDNKLTQKEIDEIAQGYVRGVEEDVIVAADHCFTADTPVLTPMGDKPIEQFKKGDEILSRPEDSPYAPARKSYVEEVFELSGDTLVLRPGGQSITTTEKHPFYVVGKGWVRAVELEPGDPLLGHDGKATAVESAVSTGRQEKVYNLRVAFDRTYFVGSRGWDFSIWVHNTYSVRLNSASGKFEVYNPANPNRVLGEYAKRDEAIARAEHLVKKNTPSDALRHWAQQGGFVNPATNKWETYSGVLEADHVYPKSFIEKLPGYEKLTPEQQDFLLNYPGNFEPLPKSWNVSKLNRLADDWAKVGMGKNASKAYIDALRVRQQAFEQYAKGLIEFWLNNKR